MAQKTIVTYIDDIDGSEAERTATFALDGKHYEIDLSPSNLGSLASALEPFVAKARSVKRSGGKATDTRSAGLNAQIRAWAQSQGLELGDRGRIPTHIVEQYNDRDKS